MSDATISKEFSEKLRQALLKSDTCLTDQCLAPTKIEPIVKEAILTATERLREELNSHCACTHDGKGDLVSECQTHQEMRETIESGLTALESAVYGVFERFNIPTDVSFDQYIKGLHSRINELEESVHLANGTADLALKHRDEAEARVKELEEQCPCKIADQGCNHNCPCHCSVMSGACICCAPSPEHRKIAANYLVNTLRECTSLKQSADQLAEALKSLKEVHKNRMLLYFDTEHSQEDVKKAYDTLAKNGIETTAAFWHWFDCTVDDAIAAYHTQHPPTGKDCVISGLLGIPAGASQTQVMQAVTALIQKVGRLHGMLLGVLHWDVPTELKERLESELKTQFPPTQEENK